MATREELAALQLDQDIKTLEEARRVIARRWGPGKSVPPATGLRVSQAFLREAVKYLRQIQGVPSWVEYERPGR